MSKQSFNMYKKPFQISYCIGVYNEEQILLRNIAKYKRSLTRILGKGNFELVLVENGSRDKSRDILKSVNDPDVISLSIRNKGHGLALKKAIQSSHFPYVVLTGMDIPFGFDDLIKARKLLREYDIVFGSKAHPDSVVGYTFTRKMLSFFFHFLLFLFFKVKIKDPHGSVFINKSKIKHFLALCDSPGSFFMSQIAIYGQRNGLRMIEIPIVLQESNNERKSSVRVVRDSFETIQFIINEFFKLEK